MGGLRQLSRRRLIRDAAALVSISSLRPAAIGRAAERPSFDFGKEFVWGASTSAYQIEGAVSEDGRGPGIWDAFVTRPGSTIEAEAALVACDHYHRAEEDVGLLVRAGVTAYRFSVSWSRILPRGVGAANRAGMDFYDRLIDRLREAGIAPWLCLYHWDLPQALQDKGGWLNRDSMHWFAELAATLGRRLGDRVDHWIMLNEAAIHSLFGHGFGTHAPGLHSRAAIVASLHHQNLAQGTGLQALRQENSRFRLGTVMCLEPVRPSSASARDRAAAEIFDSFWNRASLDPLFHGFYPANLADEFERIMGHDDIATIRQPIDFLGMNYYGRIYVQDDGSSPVGVGFGPIPRDLPFTVMGWPIEPDGLYDQLVELRDRYGNPEIYVTENGRSSPGGASKEEALDDDDRIAYISAHLSAAQLARRHGVDLRGYFVWSLLDAFEWNDGRKFRFGIVYVDWSTLARTPKKSLFWLRSIIGR